MPRRISAIHRDAFDSAESAVENTNELGVGEPFVETLINGFENDINFRPETKVRFIQSPEMLANPPLQAVPHDGGTYLARGGHSKSNLAIIEDAVVEKEPVRRPVPPSEFLEFEKFRVPLQDLRKFTFHRL